MLGGSANQGLGIEKQGPPPLPEQSSLLVPGQQDNMHQRTFSNNSDWRTWSADIDQHEALRLFNDMAYELCLRPVSLESQSRYLKGKEGSHFSYYYQPEQQH